MIKTLIGLSWQVHSPTHMCSLLDPLEIIFCILYLFYTITIYYILYLFFYFYLSILNGQRKQCGKGNNTKMKEITMRQEVYQPGPDEEVLL